MPMTSKQRGPAASEPAVLRPSAAGSRRRNGPTLLRLRAVLMPHMRGQLPEAQAAPSSRNQMSRMYDEDLSQDEAWEPLAASPQQRRPRRRRRRWPLPVHETRALEQLRAAHPDRVISWTVATPGHRGGWLALSFALTDPAYRAVGLSHAVWAPTADQLAERIAAQDALAAGVATAMNLHPPTDHGDDPLADV